MKAFRFRLDRLLGLAAAEREETARRLGEAQAQLYRHEAEAAAAASGRLEAERRLRVERGVAVRLEDWLAGEADLAAGRRTERRAAGLVAEQRGRVAERQDDYVGARREERLLQALRDRHHHRWEIENGRREQAAIDDMAQVARSLRLRRSAEGGDEGGQGDRIHIR